MNISQIQIGNNTYDIKDTTARIQKSTLPVASATEEDNIYQYIGAASGNLVTGYFYQCQSDGEPTPTYSWVRVNVQPGGTADIATPSSVGVVKPDDLTIFVNNEGTIKTRVWGGTIAEYSRVKDQIPNDTFIMISDTNAIPTGDIIINGVKIVSWANGTDAELAAMIAGHDAGKIDIHDYWKIGDERTVHINAITHRYGGAFMNDMAARDVTYILINDEYMGQSGIHFVVKQKEPLSAYGMIDRESSVEAGRNISWRDSDMREDLNDLYYNAIETDFKSLLKSFNVTTTDLPGGTTNQVTNDKIAILAEKEIHGVRVHSTTVEANALSQMKYFIDNPFKATGVKLVTRSPYDSPNGIIECMFCATDTNGGTVGININQLGTVEPFMCI